MIHNNSSHSNAKDTDITHNMTKRNIKQIKHNDLQNAFKKSRKRPNAFYQIKKRRAVGFNADQLTRRPI